MKVEWFCVGYMNGVSITELLYDIWGIFLAESYLKSIKDKSHIVIGNAMAK